MTANKNAFGNLITAFGGEEQARRFYVYGTSMTNAAVTTLNPQTYTIEANYAPSVNPTKRADKGAYRRVRREGEIRYSDNPMKWLDERVEEMQFVL